MGQPNREELLRLAIKAAKGGNKEGARVMFRQVLEQDKKNERAMIWMAKLSASKAEKVRWLNRVLDINPENEQAKGALQKMDYAEKASQNRTLFMVGGGVAFLVLLLLIVIVAIFMLPR